MSLYNMLHGRNPLAPVFLGWIGMDEGDFARFRDVFIEKNEKGEPQVHVYTRLGGGNRECFCDEGSPHYCYQVTIEALQGHALYVRDFDDDFDNTYATFVFTVPSMWRDAAAGLLNDGPTPRQKMEQLLTKLQSGDKNDPEVRAALAKMAPTVEAIQKALEGGGDTVVTV